MLVESPFPNDQRDLIFNPSNSTVRRSKPTQNSENNTEKKKVRVKSLINATTMPKSLQESPEPPQTNNTNGRKTPTISLYEQSREERIKENLQRMKKLGIVDLSHKLKSLTPRKRTPRDTTLSVSPRPTGPIRRSSRLQNVTPVSYCEVVLSKKDKSLEDEDVKLREGSKPEVYTEEHEKLLGSTERTWTFFVDGYGEDGRRIYDPVKGKTCHQCRQKTLGQRTHCSKCNMVQGQFCGDCLYMRYGEHVLDAIENPSWICPVCRGICNCSLCRQAKGWCPTGPLYKKISSLGFKSVAHYLIQTRRTQTNLENDSNNNNQVSAKRSLSFSDMEALSKESPKVNENQLGTSWPQLEDRKSDEDLNIEKDNKLQGNPAPASTKRSLPFLDTEIKSVNTDSTEVGLKVQNNIGLSKIQLEDSIDNDFKGEQKRKLHGTDNEHNHTNNTLESCPKPKRKHVAIEPIPENIIGRLRQRRRRGNDLDDVESMVVNEKSLDVKQAVNNVLSEKEMQITDDKHDSPKLKGKPSVDIEPSRDSERLPDMNEKTSDVKQAVNDVLLEKKAEINRKKASSTTPSPGSIARRLRPRIKAA